MEASRTPFRPDKALSCICWWVQCEAMLDMSPCKVLLMQLTQLEGQRTKASAGSYEQNELMDSNHSG